MYYLSVEKSHCGNSSHSKNYEIFVFALKQRFNMIRINYYLNPILVKMIINNFQYFFAILIQVVFDALKRL